jgi:hypothetical protein
MPPAVLKIAGLALLMAGAVLPAWAEAPRDPSGANRGCREVPLQHPPGWTISGSWSDDGSTLLVVDAFHNQVLRYSARGAYQGPVSQLKEGAIQGFTPSIMKGQGSSRYLELAQARMVRLDQNFSQVKAYNLKAESQREGESIEGIFLWDLAANEAVVFGDIHRPSQQDLDQQWRSGFFRIPLEAPKDFRSLNEISPKDPMRLFYRLGNPLIASLGETSYILMMEEHPRIYRNQKGAAQLEPLNAFPESLDERPTLPSWKSLDDYAWLMRVVERSTMPVALFGWEGSLFVVGRHAEDGGTRTRWSLTKIDPQADRVVWTMDVPLPSTTHHVTVVPGPQQWAWIEKGVVRGLFNQDIDRVMFLPAEKLRGNLVKNVCR